jgi:SAM-dependent methyltransferase
MTWDGTPVEGVCPSCGATGMVVFYELKDVPVHSVLLLPTKEEAIDYPRGDIVLGFCRTCGFISNLAFDPERQEYSSRYESSQAFSPVYDEFARRLALRLVERYDLHDKAIIEIGCGQGEFLTMICQIGGDRGVGFDPSYVFPTDRNASLDAITFVQDFYGDKYADYQGDLICCRMTLEHIQQTGEFVRAVRRSIGEGSDSVVFFQVPDVMRILRELAFWDIYYEHCSYFSPGSLARLFRICGFEVLDLWTDYGDQYLMIEARAGTDNASVHLPVERGPRHTENAVERFAEGCPAKVEVWRDKLEKMRQAGQRVVIWGAGSKAVAFLTTLDIRDQIAYAVDINRRKHGTYLAGTGQRIVAADFLHSYGVDVIILMNPIYEKEIKAELDCMGLAPEVLTV